jgi:phenylpropionate dioxygenase-like ring-hydroxylating dioxygenase large terminal subunit
MTAERDYPLNQWYCAAFADEVSVKPLARTICDRQIVLYRDTAGTAVALTNRCPHRKAPLSDGQVLGDNAADHFFADRAGARLRSASNRSTNFGE